MASTSDSNQSRASPQQQYDLVCVGLDPSSLAVAVALAESGTKLRPLFLERRSEFSWEPAKVLPEKLCASSFICDLVTFRNPRSEYSLTNFLQTTGQLVGFTNASHLEPSRLLMAAYLHWVAGKLEQHGWIQYDTDVAAISPVTTDTAKSRTSASGWAIQTQRQRETQRVGAGEDQPTLLKTKLLLVSASATAVSRIPAELSNSALLSSSRLLHFNECDKTLATLHHPQTQLRVAIVGDNQNAAELFEFCHTAPGVRTAAWFVSASTLRPEESHPFATIQPASLNGHPKTLPPELQQRLIRDEPYSPRITLSTIESIYALQYNQHILQPNIDQHKCKLYLNAQVTSANLTPTSDGLTLTTQTSHSPSQPFDLLISASAPSPASQNPLFATSPMASLLETPASLTVDAAYHINLRRDAVHQDVGLWLLAPLDAPHATVRADDFTHVAERAARVVRDVLARFGRKGKGTDPARGEKEKEEEWKGRQHAVL